MFGYGIDRRVIYIILGILVLFSLTSMTSSAWISKILTLPAVIIAITFHEFAHAFAADKLGDTLPKNQGRLTLNPLSHLDPVGFILLMYANIGWGKPVQINPNNFTSNKSRSACEAIVSLAGPLMNFIIAIVLTFIAVLLAHLAPMNFQVSLVGNILITLIDITIIINIGLGVFNLIPLPPLDGEKIFRHILPYNAVQWLNNNSKTLYFIFIILWITGLLSTIVSPIIDLVKSGILWSVTNIVTLFI